ncbi:hypothetical protein Y032_0086g1898 [Ancylostoma ceylanicum]|nr:hypothetical protein Y032_0086g1898 [Ancylostoma ceylanicum]
MAWLATGAIEPSTVCVRSQPRTTAPHAPEITHYSSDDVIEQYNVLCGWLCVHEKVICPDNGGIESVCFVGDRILCTHLNGSVTIADPHSDSIRRVQICPSPLWSSCAIDATHAAFVSHSASLFILELNDYTVSTPLSLGIDQRLFSVCSQKDVISIGAMDSVFIVKNNAVARKMVVPRKEKRLPTIVWTTCFFNETIVASGDSRGVISFWNFNNGALLASLESHQSDILCLVMCEDRLHAAGVDPRIMSIKRIAANDFRIVQKRNGPVRDVRAMARFDDKIYAAGEDHSIFVAKDGCQVLMNQWNKLLTFGGPLVMSRGHCFVDLWTNGTSEQSNCKGAVVVKRQPVYLARVYCPEKKTLVTCDLSSDGKILALSSNESTTVYQLNMKGEGKLSLRNKLRTKPASAVKIHGECVLMATGDFEIWVASVKGEEPQLVLEQPGCGGVSQLVVSECGKFAAVITTRLQVFVIDLKSKESRLLRVSLPIDVAFTDGESLFVLCATAGFGEPSAAAKVLHEFPKNGGPSRRSASTVDLFGAPGYRAVSITPGPGDQLVVVASDGQWVLIDKTRSSVQGPIAPPSRRPSAAVPSTLHFRSRKRVCACRLQASEPTTAPFKLKKFGQQ